ncbi:TRAP transporter small permease [Alcaligenaceae bacterium]|nr:TRAP transporter small permease [Alcaligenaceae bacterium]
MAILKKINCVLTFSERVLMGIAALMMFLIMLLVVVDVMLRYFFNSPLAWSYELISLYLMVGLFFFSLSDALRCNAHVSVDLLQYKMSARVRHGVEMVGYFFASVVFAGILYMSIERTYISYIGHDVIAGSIAWPTWLSNIAVPVGSGVMLLRMIFRVIGHGLSLLTNQSVIPLPPLSGKGEEL